MMDAVVLPCRSMSIVHVVGVTHYFVQRHIIYIYAYILYIPGGLCL